MKVCGWLLLALLAGGWIARGEDWREQRAEMVRRQIAAREVTDLEVLKSMRSVPRHEFVPDRLRRAAYDDGPLPIGFGQTISQPYIVALMTKLLDLQPGDKALEIGTGSGYQAAVLAEIIDEVYTIEIIEPLANSAKERLQKLGYDKVQVKLADGYHGWPEHAPFDAIVVTAAADHVPPPLVQQLKPGGRMVIPLGSALLRQMLVLVEKDAQGRIRTRNIAPVRFVPFTRPAD
jgi:protein-L-isoaspartate(D-aspartate) O-methyltransferase